SGRQRNRGRLGGSPAVESRGRRLPGRARLDPHAFGEGKGERVAGGVSPPSGAGADAVRVPGVRPVSGSRTAGGGVRPPGARGALLRSAVPAVGHSRTP